jgi:hypothetical protein
MRCGQASTSSTVSPTASAEPKMRASEDWLSRAKTVSATSRVRARASSSSVGPSARKAASAASSPASSA